MRQIMMDLTGIYTGEIQKILNTKNLTPQIVYSSFSRVLLTKNTAQEQKIKGFINILFSHFPKQSISNDKRESLMRLLNDFPNRYDIFLEKMMRKKSILLSEEYINKVNNILIKTEKDMNIIPLNKEDFSNLLFQFASGKVIFHIIDKIISLSKNNSLSLKSKEELNKLVKEIKSKFDLALA